MLMEGEEVLKMRLGNKLLQHYTLKGVFTSSPLERKKGICDLR